MKQTQLALPFSTHKVWFESKPDVCPKYSGYVDFSASNNKGAIDAALKQLNRNPFSDQYQDMWIVEKIERIF